MSLFFPFFKHHIKRRKAQAKTIDEITSEVRTLVKEYMNHQAELAALLETGYAERIKAKQAQVRQEKRELTALLKQREKTRSLLIH